MKEKESDDREKPVVRTPLHALRTIAGRWN